MKVRSVANGNEIDLPADHGLVVAGIYVPVEEEPPETVAESHADAEPVVFTPSEALEEAVRDEDEDTADHDAPARGTLQAQESPLMTTAHLSVAPATQGRPYKQGRKPRKPR